MGAPGMMKRLAVVTPHSPPESLPAQCKQQLHSAHAKVALHLIWHTCLSIIVWLLQHFNQTSLLVLNSVSNQDQEPQLIVKVGLYTRSSACRANSMNEALEVFLHDLTLVMYKA